MALIIVETSFDQPISDALMAEAGNKLAPCLEARGITWKHSYLSLDRKKRVCVYEAVDAEALRSAHYAAGLTFERAWPAVQLGGE